MLIPANIELKPTYPDIISIKNQTPKEMKAYDIGNIARRQPNAVPTPFPPLNLKKTGYTCPKIEANEANILI